jgi:hypothetical protein
MISVALLPIFMNEESHKEEESPGLYQEIHFLGSLIRKNGRKIIFLSATDYK